MPEQRALPKLILIVSGLFALIEFMVSFALWFSPESVVETVDLGAKGVRYIVYMWAVRQFALGFIFGYATLKKSAPMLTIAYTFFVVMMIGDVVIGIMQKENALVVGALIMIIISSAMLFALHKRK